MKELHRLTDLQLTLLDAIWRRGEATVREVYGSQTETLGLALKTVGTVLRRLEEQEILEHREERRQFVYRARVTREDVRNAAVRALADNLFAGSVSSLAAHAIREWEPDPVDLVEVRRAVDRLEP